MLPAHDGRNLSTQVNTTVHGTDGPLLTSPPQNSTVLDSHVLSATNELSSFPFNLDMNSGNPLGIGASIQNKTTATQEYVCNLLGWLQSTIGNGNRTSSATAFLSGTVLDRPNLDILLGTRATKLLKTGKQGKTTAFRSVELQKNATGSGHLVFPICARDLIRNFRAVFPCHCSEGNHPLCRSDWNPTASDVIWHR